MKLTTRIRFSRYRICTLNMASAICNEGFDKYLINCRRCALEAGCARTLMVFSVIGQKRWQRLLHVAAYKLIIMCSVQLPFRLQLYKRRRKSTGVANDSHQHHHAIGTSPFPLTTSWQQLAANRWQIKQMPKRMHQALILISASEKRSENMELCCNCRNWCAPILLRHKTSKQSERNTAWRSAVPLHSTCHTINTTTQRTRSATLASYLLYVARQHMISPSKLDAPASDTRVFAAFCSSHTSRFHGNQLTDLSLLHHLRARVFAFFFGAFFSTPYNSFSLICLLYTVCCSFSILRRKPAVRKSVEQRRNSHGSSFSVILFGFAATSPATAATAATAAVVVFALLPY